MFFNDRMDVFLHSPPPDKIKWVLPNMAYIKNSCQIILPKGNFSMEVNITFNPQV